MADDFNETHPRVILLLLDDLDDDLFTAIAYRHEHNAATVIASDGFATLRHRGKFQVSFSFQVLFCLLLNDIHFHNTVAKTFRHDDTAIFLLIILHNPRYRARPARGPAVERVGEFRLAG